MFYFSSDTTIKYFVCFAIYCDTITGTGFIKRDFISIFMASRARQNDQRALLDWAELLVQIGLPYLLPLRGCAYL